MPSTTERVEKARAIFEELKQINATRNMAYWLQAEQLAKLKKDNTYKFVFGENNQSWTSFLSEIGMPASSVDQKIKNFEFYVSTHAFTLNDLKDIDTSSLYMLTLKKMSAPREEVAELIESAKVMGRGDFIGLLKGHNDCMHSDTEEKTVIMCKTCNRKVGSKR